MPPKKLAGTITAEEMLATRVAVERETRGWSPAGLAARMTQAGCPMTQSGIWKIENGNPRRRITLDEAAAFCKVFGIPMNDLSLHDLEFRVKGLLGVASEYHARIRGDVQHLARVVDELKDTLNEDGPLSPVLRKAAETWLQVDLREARRLAQARLPRRF